MTSTPDAYLLSGELSSDDDGPGVANDGQGVANDACGALHAEPAEPAGAAPQGRRDPPVARLLRLLRALAAGDGARGFAAADLVSLGGYPADDRDAAMTQLQRDIRRLGTAGWGIENIAALGSPARYVLHPNDLAERAGLAPGEQSALEAALAAQGEHVVERASIQAPPVIGRIRHALDRHCVIEMTYDDKLRRVHPMRLHNPPGRWLLRAMDEHDDVIKWFLLNKVQNLSLDDPGTARVGIEDADDSLDPHRWRVDAPVTAELMVEQQHVVHVRQTLDLPISVISVIRGNRDVEDDPNVRLTLEVTNRRALFDWLVTMGPRVRLAGPPDLLRDFLGRLEAVADGQD